ncbi:MAG: hypothetical protein AABY22_16360 [Nanoarchaeota archaeon]
MKLKQYPQSDETEFILKKIQHRIKYLQYIANGVQFYGIKKLEKELKELDLFKKLESEPLMEGEENVYLKKHTKELIELIIQICLKQYEKHRVTRKDIFEMKIRGRVTELKKIIILLILDNVKISDVALGKYFSRDRQVIYSIINEYRKKLKKPKDNKQFLDNYNELKRRIDTSKKIRSLKNKQHL